MFQPRGALAAGRLETAPAAAYGSSREHDHLANHRRRGPSLRSALPFVPELIGSGPLFKEAA